MAMTKNVLKAKARGFTISIEKMNENQRTSSPTGNFGEDYNRLRSLVLELRPDLQAALPPAVTTFPGVAEGTFTRESYGEIDTYCEQIFQMLSSED